jgi:hypothetical protein
VKRVPSEYAMESVWTSTWPIAEATADGEWARHFDQAALMTRVVYGSHAPFDGDGTAVLTEQLGADAATVLGNGAQLLPRVAADRP